MLPKAWEALELELVAYQGGGMMLIRGWDALVKVSGKTLEWANLETAFSKRIDKNWKLTATAYVWDSRSLLGERNSLKLSDNKTSQASIGVAYEY